MILVEGVRGKSQRYKVIHEEVMWLERGKVIYYGICRVAWYWKCIVGIHWPKNLGLAFLYFLILLFNLTR